MPAISSDARSDSRLTPVFRIDSVPPELSAIQIRRLSSRTIEVGGQASDAAAPLRRVDVSVDGGPFQRLGAVDGIFDTGVESFAGQAVLAPDQVGSWIVVRAQDAAGNRGLYRAWLEE